MSNTQIIAVGAVIIVVGIAGWLMFGKTAVAPTDEATGVTSVDETNDENEMDAMEGDGLSGRGTIAELLARGDSIRCEYTFTSAETGTGEGTGYFADGKMRIDSTFTDPDGSTYETDMIDDGATIYSWSRGPEGEFAMQFASPDEDEADTTPVTPEDEATVDTDTEVTYDCESWNADEGQFVPPSDIEFVDLQAMMEGAFNANFGQ